MKYLAVVGAWWGLESVAAAALDRRGWSMLFFPEQFRVSLDERPRYVFFLNWSRTVPADIVNNHECVNFHCTPLPYGRGGHPIENMILAGHAETIITAHRMTSEMDAGPIYGTRGPISLAGAKADIHQRFIEPVADLMRWIVETEPEPTPQQGEPVLFSRLSPEAYRQFWEGRQ
jgi:methionyl-tRNA formyltransferase